MPQIVWKYVRGHMFVYVDFQVWHTNSQLCHYTLLMFSLSVTSWFVVLAQKVRL